MQYQHKRIDLGQTPLGLVHADSWLIFAMLPRHLVKSVYQKTIFLISQPKHMLWVLKRTVSMRRFFLAPKTYVKIDG